jgi:sulfotransferase family protein
MTEAAGLGRANSLPGCEAYAGACSDPVFVLCMGRSGSTLLRVLLDVHPDLACPPETKLPEAFARLITLWSAMEAFPLQAQGDGQVTQFPATVEQGIRHTADLIVGPYLARRGKKRYCDKNLGTALHADMLLRVFPEAKFICLYRHPMDVIASGIEACPWGLASYGFEPYAAGAPGNSVAALARYWVDHTAGILTVEERYPERCHRVRYEDLVEEPDTVTQKIFEFLGLSPVPGIADQCFSADHDRFGAGDFKIWNTSRITGDSVGRGWSIPVSLIAPITPMVNALADKLGYRCVDENWGVAARPGDLRVTADGQVRLPPAAVRGLAGPVPAGSLLVSERLQTGLRNLYEPFADGWKPYSEESFVLVSLAPSNSDGDAWWLVDPAARKVVSGSGTCDEDAVWTVIAPAATWEQVIRDGVNVGTAFRRHGMRYRDKGDGGPGSLIAECRVAMMGDLLGITEWRPSPASASAVPPAPDDA